MAETKPDQADILALNGKLEGDLKAANATAATVTAERDTLRTEVAGLTSSNATLTKANADLKSENDSLKASQTEFDAKVAAKVAELGINSKATETNATKKASTREEVLAEMSAIKDPSERTKFYRDNKAAIHARPTV
jgi:FtsZ-binding cell division protein ZapB